MSLALEIEIDSMIKTLKSVCFPERGDAKDVQAKNWIDALLWVKKTMKDREEGSLKSIFNDAVSVVTKENHQHCPVIAMLRDMVMKYY